MKPAKEKNESTKEFGVTPLVERNMKTFKEEKKEWHLPPEWQSASPVALASLWIYSPPGPDDWEWSVGLDTAGILQNLLLPVWGLQFYGSVDAIREKKDTVLKAAAIVGDFPGLMMMNTSHWAIYALNLKHFAVHLEHVISRLEDAEKKLQREGWRFNPATRKTSRIAGHKGRDFLAECVWAIYTAKHREEYSGASDAKKLSIRRKIAAVLAPYFNAPELSPASGAPIYMAIYKGENPPK